MATKNSVQYAKEINVPQQLKEPYEMAGVKRSAYATYVAAAFAIGDTLNLFTLPTKARIVGGYMEHDGLAPGTTEGTIALGYAGASDAILAATGVGTAGRTQLPKLGSIGADMGGKLIIATLATTAATDGKVLTVCLEYVID